MNAPSPSTWLARLAPALLLAVLALAYYAPALAEGRMLAPGDGIAYYFDIRTLAFSAIKQGEMPFWNPYIFSGTPLLAALQGGLFFPGNWTFLALPPVWAFNVTFLLAIWTAGFGTYVFCRAIALGRLPALAAGIAFMFGGFMVFNAQHLTMVQAAGFLGLLLWAVERLARAGRRRYAIAFSLLLGLQILAGHPQMTAYSLIAAGAYALWRGWALPGAERLRMLGELGAACALGVGLSLLQLLPTLELIQASQRQAISYERLVISSLSVEALPTLLLPFLYGAKLASTIMPVPAWASVDWRGGVEGYVGLPALMLAAIAAMRWRAVPQVRFWLPVAVLAIALAMGKHTPLYPLWAKLPVVSMMPFASRHLFEATFALAVLAGLGASAVTARLPGRHLGWGLAFVGAPLAIVAGAVLVIGPGFAARTQAYLPEGIDLAFALSPQNPGLWLPFVIFLATAGLCTALRRRPLLTAGVLGLLVADLAVFGHHHGRLMEAPHVPSDLGTAQSPVPDMRQGRVMAIARWKYPYNGDNFDYLRTLRMPNVATLDGVPSVGGFDAFILRRYGSTLGMVSDGFFQDEAILRDPDHHAVDLLGLRTLILDSAVAEKPEWRALDPARWREMPGGGEVAAFENARAMPRAWRVGEVRVVDPAAVAAEVKASSAFDPARTALVEQPVAEQAWQPGAAEAETLSINRIRLRTEGEGPGFVVVSESYDPGWRAFLGDRELPVHRVDGLVLGLVVPAGRHEIVFTYEPRPWRLGLAGSGLSLALLLAWGLMPRRKGRPA